MKALRDNDNPQPANNEPKKRRIITGICAILALLSAALYLNTLKNDFALDDVMVLSENRYVQQGLAGIPHLLTTHHLEGFGANSVSDYYRPLSLVMFAAGYQLWGLNPAAEHAVNIIVFAACVVLLFLFFDKLFNREKTLAAFVACLLFAVHPIHTEVVANIKSRDELLCFFFSFAALLLLTGYVQRGGIGRAATGFFCLFLAVLSKETAVTFLVVIPLIFFFYQNSSKKRSALVTGGMSSVVILFLLLWNYAQTRHPGQESVFEKFGNTFSSTGHHLTMLAPEILILGYHLRLLFFPYPLSSNYSFGIFASADFKDVWVWISLAAYLALLFTAIYRLARFKKDPWAFGILFFLITLSLYSNIILPLGQPIANRYDFFASAGFCWLIALGYEKWILQTHTNDFGTLKKIKSMAILAPVLLCYSVMTVARNADWKDNLTLVSADLPKTPDDYVLQYKAGLELQVKYNQESNKETKRALNDESIGHFLASIAMNPDYTESRSDLGVAYFQKGLEDSAEYEYRQALRINPLHFNSNFNLATLYFKQQRFGEALTYYAKCLVTDPNTVEAWYNRGVCFARTGQMDSTVFCMKKALQIAPQFDHYKAYGNIAIEYKMMGNADSAKKYERLTQQYYPDFHLH